MLQKPTVFPGTPCTYTHSRVHSSRSVRLFWKLFSVHFCPSILIVCLCPPLPRARSCFRVSNFEAPAPLEISVSTTFAGTRSDRVRIYAHPRSSLFARLSICLDGAGLLIVIKRRVTRSARGRSEAGGAGLMTTVMEYRKWDGARTTRPGLRANGYTGVYVSWSVGPCRLEQQNACPLCPVLVCYLMQFPTGLQACFRDATVRPFMQLDEFFKSIDRYAFVRLPPAIRSMMHVCVCVCVAMGFKRK